MIIKKKEYAWVIIKCNRWMSVFCWIPFVLIPSDLPSTGGSLSVAGKKAEPQAALADADADLEERLNNLRKD